MPADAREALTLDLGQTKDHTVQAVMRLRQLGTTQSVIWVSPPEGHQSILGLRSKRPRDLVDSHHVICWLEANLRRYCHSKSAVTNKEVFVEQPQRRAYLKVLRTVEQQTLEELYGPKSRAVSHRCQYIVPQIDKFLFELRSRRTEFQNLMGLHCGRSNKKRDSKWKQFAMSRSQCIIQRCRLNVFIGTSSDSWRLAEQ